jgi:uncharacterized membrane protein YbaN (DUF454 family)
VNHDEAKNILLLYRPGTADADDPQIAGALALAKREPELARWLEDHSTRQEALRSKFRQITVPAGLKEQIISESAARAMTISRQRRNTVFAAVAAMASVVILLIVLSSSWLPHRQNDDNTLAIYQNQMVRIALNPYGMDLTTNDSEQVRAYLATRQAPADYDLPPALQKAAFIGCAVEGWQNVKVSMICFRTGKPLPPNQSSDLWLFVVDRASLKGAPESSQPRFAAVKGLITAVWAQGDRVYLLGTEGDESAIRKFL